MHGGVAEETRYTSPAPSVQCIYVLSEIDGFKYKLVLQGEVRLLSTDKIRRYLENATGLKVDEQYLSFHGRVVPEGTCGADIGLFSGAVMHVRRRHDACRRHSRGHAKRGHNAPASRECGQRRDGDSHRHSSNRSTYREGEGESHRAGGGLGTVGSRSTGRTTSLRPLSVAQENSRSPASPSCSLQQEDECTDYTSGNSPPIKPESTQYDSRHRCDMESHKPDCIRETSTGDRQNRHVTQLENVVDTLREENILLREQLHQAEREAANATSDWQLEEEAERLRGTVARLRQEKTAAINEAQNRWRMKEEELIKEMDALRAERRRMRAEKDSAYHEEQSIVHSLREEISVQRTTLQEQQEMIQQLRFHLAELQAKRNPTADSPSPPRSRSSMPLDKLANGLLVQLACTLSLPTSSVALDANNTCIIPVEEGMNVLVTLDTATERLYLYATLLDYLPESPSARLALYEMLLEGALLGKDMAGGGVGICRQNELVLMSISVDVRYSDTAALAEVAIPFIQQAVRWVKEVDRQVGR